MSILKARVKNPQDSTEEKKEIIIDILKQYKAEDILIMKMTDITSVTDYFILCSSDNTMLSSAIVEETIDVMKKYRWKPLFHPQDLESRWIILDYGDIVLHIFHPDERKHYDLETLWDQAAKTFIST